MLPENSDRKSLNDLSVEFGRIELEADGESAYDLDTGQSTKFNLIPEILSLQPNADEISQIIKKQIYLENLWVKYDLLMKIFMKFGNLRE